MGRRLLSYLLVVLLLVQPAMAAERVIYYHQDLQGSTVAATDEQGQVLFREEYTPYGERQLEQSGSEVNQTWYTGKPHSESLGLTYLGARWYDPAIGRFMAVDPVGFTGAPASFNRYAYGNNSPYKYVDPDGREAVRLPWFGPAPVPYPDSPQHLLLIEGGYAIVDAAAANARMKLQNLQIVGVLATQACWSPSCHLVLSEGADDDYAAPAESDATDDNAQSLGPYPDNPDKAPEKYTYIKNRKGKENTEDGSVWERDHSSHGGEQWKRWPNRRSYDKRDKPQSIWAKDGRVRK